ncbi:metal ABC transporter permease [Helicobacter saguini]|uniref:Metal ABC transporter permease n=1 Tax=Helicobacter saguini TaxID=1548018 RepID=A0A347VRI7_9HELI|nr:metal ABC transporter permease [Helicobacter saguini]MWV62886.1 metal ABC transporter permease [Helicobacter saguini]MWV66444.1 metal ABC transporter permease [Helicobacter saguini]MWV68793.1 metal ABC transporter permease [Helicobacter saguini]MWV71652.1 metal ABC transporter permease [Helicobacter saguini]TLD94454.1 metal ABC transporter permease [Helicobacter saguini]
MSFLDAIFENIFLQNALLGIGLIAVISGIVGSLLVSNKIVFLGGGVAHSAYGGIGVAFFYGFSLLLGATLSAIFVAFVLAIVKKKYAESIDTFSAILWAFGMALGVIFMNLSSNINADIESYLFGSLLSVDNELLAILLGFDILLLFFTICYYKEILYVSYDYEFCKLKGLKVSLISNIIFAFIAIGVVLSMQISGLMLVLAMLSIPAFIANMFVKSLSGQMIFAGILSGIFMIFGLFFAFSYNFSVGASITLVSIVFLGVFIFLKLVLRRLYG